MSSKIDKLKELYKETTDSGICKEEFDLYYEYRKNKGKLQKDIYVDDENSPKLITYIVNNEETKELISSKGGKFSYFENTQGQSKTSSYTFWKCQDHIIICKSKIKYSFEGCQSEGIMDCIFEELEIDFDLDFSIADPFESIRNIREIGITSLQMMIIGLFTFFLCFHENWFNDWNGKNTIEDKIEMIFTDLMYVFNEKERKEYFNVIENHEKSYHHLKLKYLKILDNFIRKTSEYIKKETTLTYEDIEGDILNNMV